jgi:tetratricopeptide (TPR) repeat protein
MRVTRCFALLIVLLATAASYGSTPATSDSFDKLAERAQAALEANQVPEAIRLYQRATALRPTWAEGWWHLGTMYYDEKNFQQARNAFRHFVSVEHKQPGPGFAMLGLTEFQLAHYPEALGALEHGIALGLGPNLEFNRDVLYHDGILQSLRGEPEIAVQRLTLAANQIAAANPEMPKEAVLSDSELLQAMGIAALRIPKLPSEIQPLKIPLVHTAGHAEALIALNDRITAEQELKALADAYPNEPGVHYFYGSFLLKEHPVQAVAELRKELAISPMHVAARLAIAFEFLRSGENLDEALKYSKEAVALAPQNFVAHVAYGRALLDDQKAELAVQQLQMAVKLAPGSPDAHFALARAFTQAGRQIDAARERKEFERLTAINEAAKR